MDQTQCLSQSIYHPSKENQWTGVNWSKTKKTIENLQYRITKAAERGEYRKVRNLQRLLNHSLSARLKAVRIVAQENSAKNTPGIDGKNWTTPEQKLQAAFDLRKRSRTKPLKRMFIPNTKKKMRSIDILCMSDRARQALWNMSILPCVKANSDQNYRGFELTNAQHKKINAQIRHILNKKNSPSWILDANIEKYSDQIHHDWLLANTSIETKILKSWLKAGYFKENQLFPTEKSTLQDIGLLTTLSNFTLNGLKEHLKLEFQPEQSYSETRKTPTFQVVRYAENVIVLGLNPQQLKCIKMAINKFLALRGLQLNEEKTHIRHISEGFDFLGWNFRRYADNKFLCKISKNSISEHRREIKYLTKKIHQPEILIPKLNRKIHKWVNYHNCCNGVNKVWGSMNMYLYKCLMKWGRRRHGNKSIKWIFERYWKHINGRWTFTVTTNENITYTLTHYNFELKSQSCNTSDC